MFDRNKTVYLTAVIAFTLSACSGNTTKQRTSEVSPEVIIHQGYSATADQYEVEGVVISNVDLTAKLWNPRDKTKEQVYQRALYLADAYNIKETAVQQQRALQAREKYADAIAINAVMPGSVDLAGLDEEKYTIGLNRNKDAGITMVSTTVFAVTGDSPTPELERMEKSTAVIEKLNMALVKDTTTIRLAKKDDQLAVMFNAQGSDYLAEDFSRIRTVKDKGLGVANFVYNYNNTLAGGSEKQDAGLTDLGKEFIKEANKNGVIIDVSHSSNQTAIEAAKISTKPIIASHSNVYALHPASRNMTDEAMKSVATTGGVVCTTGAGLFINKELDPNAEAVAEHIEYTANLIGRDKTCFGTDYVHGIVDYYNDFLEKVHMYPPEKGFGSPSANMGPEHIWSTVAVLEDKYGWSEKDIKGFLGENLMRVYDANWK